MDYRPKFRPSAKHLSEFVVGGDITGEPRIWICSECGHQGRWGKGWAVYCSLLEEDYDYAEKLLCPECAARKNIIYEDATPKSKTRR